MLYLTILYSILYLSLRFIARRSVKENGLATFAFAKLKTGKWFFVLYNGDDKTLSTKVSVETKGISFALYI